jgi:cell division protein FtsZ
MGEEIFNDEVISPICPGEISEDRTVIKVIGVGGGGTNAVNHMYKLGIQNVDFLICNTDMQSLRKSEVPAKIQLGAAGRGAGNNPEKGRSAAEYSIEAVRSVLENSTEMVFITAGMGGGTGTGAAPLIAKTAKEMGILTVGIVTIPFLFEGKRRLQQAFKGVEEMRKHVDSLLVISTEKIKKEHSDLKLSEAFSYADDILATAAKGIAEIITVPGYINVDLEDIKTVMTNSGNVVMGSAKAQGRGRALDAIVAALDSPLLLSSDLTGARDILLNIASSPDSDVSIDELTTITDYIKDAVKCEDNQIIWGTTKDNTLQDDEVKITIVATGFTDDDIEDGIGMSATATPVAAPAQSSFVGKMISHFGTAGNDRQEPVVASTKEQDEERFQNQLEHYYGSPMGKTQPAPTTQTMTSGVPDAPSTFFDDEPESQGIPTYHGSIGNDQTSSYSLIPGEGLNFDDKNDYLHNNVD